MGLIQENWSIILGGIAFVVWLIRLEGQINQLKQMQKIQQKEIDVLLDLKTIVIEMRTDISWIRESIDKK